MPLSREKKDLTWGELAGFVREELKSLEKDIREFKKDLDRIFRTELARTK